MQRGPCGIGQGRGQPDELEESQLGEGAPRLGGGGGWCIGSELRRRGRGLGLGCGVGAGTGTGAGAEQPQQRLAWSTSVSHCARAGARILSSAGSTVCLRSCLPGSGSRAAASLWPSCVRSAANSLNLRKAHLPSRTEGMRCGARCRMGCQRRRK